MDEITKERLLTNFDEVLTQIEKIVKNKDIDGAKEALSQIEALVNNNEEIPLDDRDNYDHVLHELLSKINGKIEIDKDEKALKIANEKKEQLTKELVDLKKALKELEAKDNKTDVDNKKIEENKSKQEELSKKLQEVKKEIAKYSSKSLDLKEEASRIGDHIFKTKVVRDEIETRLEKGELTREDFFKFYNNGLEEIKVILEKSDKEIQSIKEENGKIGADSESDKNLFIQAKEATETKEDDKLIKIYEKMRNNLIKNNLYEKELKKAGLFDTKINSIEQSKKFKDEILTYIVNKNGKRIEELDNLTREQKENIQIIQRQIQIIKDEQKSIEQSKKEDSEIFTDIDNEKELRAKQIRATILNDDESKKLREEWNERVRRFDSNKNENGKTFYYTDKNGEQLKFTYSTIDDYEGYQEDANFLNLNDYKRNLELVTLYKNCKKNLEVMYAFMTDEEKEQFVSMNNIPGSAVNSFDEYMKQKEEYVKTFHGFTNEHEVKYANLRTSGSTLKSMKPVKGDLPTTTKIGNGISNFFRFFGLRMPDFNKSKLGGALTLATDAAVIGGIVATGVFVGPIGLATWGAGYAAKGIVTLKDRIKSRIEYKRHGDEIRKNLPILGKPNSDAREVARKHYYRNVEGKNRFTSWLKAKSDKYLFRKRLHETENKIAEIRIAESNATIDQRVEDAKKKIKDNVVLAEKNQKARVENTKKVVKGKNTYNDIVRDPDEVIDNETHKVKDSVISTIATNAALQINGRTALDVNKNSKVERKSKYTKDDEKLENISDLHEVRTKGDTVATTAITREEQYTGVQQKIDRFNKLWTILLTAGARVGIGYLKNEFSKQVTETRIGADQQIPGKTHKEPIYKDEVSYEFDPNQSISKMKYDSKGLHDVYGGSQITDGAISGKDVNAFVLRTTDAKGNIIETSIASTRGGFTGQQTHILTDENLSNLGMIEAIEKLKTSDPIWFNKFLEAKGLSSNISTTELAKNVMENGEFLVQTKLHDGWKAITPDNLVEKITKVPTGEFKIVSDPAQIIPGKTETITKNIFDSTEIAKAAAKGAAVGAAVTLADTLHEAANQTKKVDPGNFENNNELLETSKYYQLAMKTAEEQQRTPPQNPPKNPSDPEPGL